MASFFRRHVNSRTLGLGLTMGFMGSSWASCEEKQPVAKKRMEFIGVFLDAESQEALKKRFPALHFDTSAQSNIVLKYNPSQEEVDAFSPILGKEAKINIQAYVEDENTQAAIVAVSTEHGDVHYSVDCPHITLSFSGEEGFSRAYSNVLLERLQASGSLTVEDTKDGLNVGVTDFDGQLPAFDSKLFPFYSPFPSTQAKLTVLSEPIALSGIICSSATYDSETHACLAAPKKAECGFCLFMKAGPCGKEFSAWEACLDESKKNGTDFLTVCGSQTLALRDCVDANPEYYSVLNGDGDDEEESEEKASS
ncbi:hypothetical protein LEN26_018214 [Aphanomyces euteiches]|nr:hypothetical protein LEN26_018214 [Aphanomyces euteiches]KAH9111454.1 hypothetical protein AeMF1_014020 [Aphanomyces euteiches]KAH9190244.1 hypothetical protein AeNC1_007780 [Aphanomyces euteiches]